MKSFKVFYHDDLDGICSAAIVHHWLKTQFSNGYIVEYSKINYGMEFPYDTIDSEDTVIMVDFGIQPFEGMIKLRSLCENFIWIDHHATAIKACEEYNAIDITGLRRIGLAGCELTWEYFMESEQQIPQAIELLGQYDTWRKDGKFNWDTKVMAFQYGMKKYLSPTDPIWEKLFNGYDYSSDIISIIEKGTEIVESIKASNIEDCKKFVFETELDGLKCLAVNKYVASTFFESMWDATKYDAMITFAFQKTCWSFSLFTDKPGIDVSVIAKARGGGGHIQAAGWQSKTIPFNLPIK